jgi:hypothetical protein
VKVGSVGLDGVPSSSIATAFGSWAMKERLCLGSQGEDLSSPFTFFMESSFTGHWSSFY